MKILLAPASFKGSMMAPEAAEAMVRGIRAVHPSAELVLLPLTDGGAGALSALGVRFLDKRGQSLPRLLDGAELARLAAISRSSLRFPPHLSLIIASDVTNPLLGPSGAAAVYGPQKGADAAAVAALDTALANYAAVIRRD